MSLYAYVKWKLIWYRNNDAKDQVDLTRYIKNISTNKNFNPVNNLASVDILDNNLLYINNQFVPQENDKMFIWAKIITSASDSELTTDDIIWNGKFVDHERKESPDERIIKLRISDWGYEVYNRMFTQNFLDGTHKTDEIMTKVIKTLSEEDDGTYRIDTSNVATTRNNGTPFPLISYGPTTSPVYEWFNEVSGIVYTNSPEEALTGYIVKYPMILDFRGNEAHWFEQPLTEVLEITGILCWA